MAPASSRRAWLAATLGSALAGPLAGCAQLPGAPATQAQAVAPGVYLLPGLGGEAAPDNRGRIGHAGFIVGEQGVLVIDSGTSARHGAVLLAAVRRVTALPVRALLLTHVRQEFVFGASAFQDAGIPVLMHPAAARLMAARCAQCLKGLQALLGEAEMAGTRVVVPDQLHDPAWPTVAPFGAAVGRDLRLLAAGAEGHSSGPGDLAVFDEATGTLFAGGWMDAQRIPDVQDSRLEGWRAALDAVDALPVQRIVPGHGPVSPPALTAQTRRYLDQLEARMAELLAAGTPLSEVADRATLPEFATWDQADTIHRRNASIVFLRQERALLLR